MLNYFRLILLKLFKAWKKLFNQIHVQIKTNR